MLLIQYALSINWAYFKSILCHGVYSYKTYLYWYLWVLWLHFSVASTCHSSLGAMINTGIFHSYMYFFLEYVIFMYELSTDTWLCFNPSFSSCLGTIMTILTLNIQLYMFVWAFVLVLSSVSHFNLIVSYFSIALFLPPCPISDTFDIIFLRMICASFVLHLCHLVF